VKGHLGLGAALVIPIKNTLQQARSKITNSFILELVFTVKWSTVDKMIGEFRDGLRNLYSSALIKNLVSEQITKPLPSTCFSIDGK
jgi:hypothetical protein